MDGAEAADQVGVLARLVLLLQQVQHVVHRVGNGLARGLHVLGGELVRLREHAHLRHELDHVGDVARVAWLSVEERRVERCLLSAEADPHPEPRCSHRIFNC